MRIETKEDQIKYLEIPERAPAVKRFDMATPEADEAMSDDDITHRTKTARPRSPTVSNDSDIRDDLDMDSMQRMSPEDRRASYPRS